MLRYLNDISIRGKLILIVVGIVTLLTIAMLASVTLRGRSEVDTAVHDELVATRYQVLVSEGEHMREHVYEAKIVAGTADVALNAKDKTSACKLISNLLSKENRLDADDPFDLAAVVLPENAPLAVSVRGKSECLAQTSSWTFPAIDDRNRSEVINWEAPDGNFYELVEAPVHTDDGRDVGTAIIGFMFSDTLAFHIRQHTGQQLGIALWRMKNNQALIVGASSKRVREVLEPRLQQGPLGAEELLQNKFSILTAPIRYQSDIIYKPNGLSMALLQSRERKLQPFLDLRTELLQIAGLNLILGLVVCLLISHPMTIPLKNLADAAESVSNGNLDMAHDLMQRHPARLHSKDEIGVLGRSFLRMVQGLKERLAMSTFVSAATYEHIRHNTEDGRKEETSERMSLTILFSDVRKFTSFSETRDPEVVIQMLNQVLGTQVEIIEKHGGDIDKFVGDAVVAWFPGSDGCQRAVHAANEMIAALQARFHGQPGTNIGVGINVGDVVVGSVGTSVRRDYTAIGSNVNLAARLCSSAEPGQVLISKSVAAQLGNDIALKPLTPISLKGFTEPIPIFAASISTIPSA